MKKVRFEKIQEIPLLVHRVWDLFLFDWTDRLGILK